MASDFSAFATQISGSVLTPGNEEYGNALRHWAANVDRKAAMIVQAASSADVAVAVYIHRDSINL